MSDRLWTIFSELCSAYRKVSYRPNGVVFVVFVENKGKSAAISDFISGWWLELRREDAQQVFENVIDTVDELLKRVHEWLDQ
jgi:hypothetical protein